MSEHHENTESIEDLGRAGFRLIQSRHGFRFGEDSTLLAYFASVEAHYKRNGTKVLELGTNCGAASILLAARRSDVRIDGVEINIQATEIFRRNIRLNQLEERVRAFAADLRDEEALQSVIQKASYDLVFFNPPFYTPGHGPASTGRNARNERQEARYEVNFHHRFIAAKSIWSLRGKWLWSMSPEAAEVMAGRRPSVLSPRNFVLFIREKKSGNTFYD